MKIKKILKSIDFVEVILASAVSMNFIGFIFNVFLKPDNVVDASVHGISQCIIAGLFFQIYLHYRKAKSRRKITQAIFNIHDRNKAQNKATNIILDGEIQEEIERMDADEKN